MYIDAPITDRPPQVTEPIRVTDPDSGHVWTVPRKPTTVLNADVAERWVANVALNADRFPDLVPLRFLEPELVQGRLVVSLCAIAMRHGGPDWAPLRLTPASWNAALRIACRDRRTGEAVVWVDHRYTTSCLGRILPLLGFPPVLPCLEWHQDGKGPDTTGLRITSLDRGVDLQLHAGEAYRPADLFADAAAFDAYFTAGIRSYGPTGDLDRFTVVDLEKRSDNHFVQVPELIGFLGTPWGHWAVESVYLTQNGSYRWRSYGEVDIAGNSWP